MNKLPNTFILGVQKAGTTTLHDWLSQHPEIFGVNKLKDVDFFSNPSRYENLEELLSEGFSRHNNEPIIIHSCVNYLLYKDAINKIYELNPNAKIIVILRNPIDRAISAYKYFKKLTKEVRQIDEALLYQPKSNLTFSRYNNDFTYIEHGLYNVQLTELFKVFPKDNIQIIEFGEFKEQPSRVLKTIFEFLNVSVDFTPNYKVRNITGEIKNTKLQSWLMGTNSFKSKIIKLAGRLGLDSHKRQFIKKRIIDFNTTSKHQDQNKKVNLDDSNLKNTLFEIFKDDVKNLDTLLNADYYNKWFQSYLRQNNEN